MTCKLDEQWWRRIQFLDKTIEPIHFEGRGFGVEGDSHSPLGQMLRF